MSEITLQHPELEKENSLTAPADRDRALRWRPDQGALSLTESEVGEAMKALNNTAFTDKFPRVDRTYQDPPIPMQNIGLISFVPSKGAKPDKHGVYGFAKLRGNYTTPTEADQRAEYIIRNADSYNQIYHAYVGRPFPMTISDKYSAETAEVDIRRQTTEAVSSNIKAQKDQEQKTMNDIKDREEQMLVESKKAREDDGTGEPPEEDPYDRYITLCVKKAQVSWTFLEHLKKLKEVRDIIVKTRKDILEADDKYPEFRGKYFEKYMEARRNSGLDENVRESQDNFMKFMVEEAVIPTVDTDEKLPETDKPKEETVADPLLDQNGMVAWTINTLSSVVSILKSTWRHVGILDWMRRYKNHRITL